MLIGFLPLIFSSLMLYVIVGVFLASIIVLSWPATVVALQALVSFGGAEEPPPLDEVDPDPDVHDVPRVLQPQ